MDAEETERQKKEELTSAPADGDGETETAAGTDGGAAEEFTAGEDDGTHGNGNKAADESAAAVDGGDGYDAAMQEYGRRAEEDARELRAMFPELSALSGITALPDPIRFAELRDLGLSAREAYLATSGGRRQDNRAHLHSAYPSPAHTPAGMSDDELRRARELFSDLSDTEIRKLYKRISG